MYARLKREGIGKRTKGHAKAKECETLINLWK